MGAGQKQVCEAAVLSEKTAVIMAASQVQEKVQGQDTAEELQTGAEDFLNIKAFHLQEVEESLEMKYEDEQKTAVVMALCETNMILTGGPGTGKSATSSVMKSYCTV